MYPPSMSVGTGPREVAWESFEGDAASHWNEVRARGGARAALEVAARLNAHVRALRPDWPSAAERQADLAHHQRMLDALRRSR